MINHLLLAYVWYLFHEYHWYPKFPQSSHHRRGSPSAELLLKTATRLNGRRSLGFGEVFEQSVPGAPQRHAGRDVAWKKGFTQNILRKDHFCIKPSAEIGCHREKQEKIGRCQNHKLKGELCKMDRNWRVLFTCANKKSRTGDSRSSKRSLLEAKNVVVWYPRLKGFWKFYDRHDNHRMKLSRTIYLLGMLYI